MDLDKYNDVFTEAFNIAIADLNAELIYQSIPAWDSVGHMSLMAMLEESFDIMFDTDDIIDFSSYEKGKEIMKKYGINL